MTLFDIYILGIPDATFHNDMNRLQDDWMDQKRDMHSATHKDIIKRQKNYDLLVNSGKWGAKSPDPEKIITLEAQFKELKNLKLSTQPVNKLKQGQKGKDQQN